MFKKTLIAATLAAISTGAMAVKVATPIAAETFGSEALTTGAVANDGSVLTHAVITLTAGAEYSKDDVITLTLSGGEFAADGAYTLTDAPLNSGGLLVNNTLSFGLLSQTKTELIFRVTEVTPHATIPTPSTVGNIFTLAGAGTLANALIIDSTANGASVSLNAAAATSTGIVIDKSANDTADIAEVANEHKLTVTVLSKAVIDVSKERKEFVEAAATAAVLSVVHAYSATDKANIVGATANITVNGSMVGFVGKATEGYLTSDNVEDTNDYAAVAADKQSAVFEATPAGVLTGKTYAMQFAVATDKTKREVLAASTYDISMEITKAGKTFTLVGDAGAMTLNGKSATFGYVPVNYDGAVVTQFEIGNSGVVDGDISLTAFDTAGNDYSANLAKKAVAGQLTQISDADISTAFDLTKGTKLNLTITVNAPNGDVTISGYSNRGTTGRMAVSANKTN